MVNAMTGIKIRKSIQESRRLVRGGMRSGLLLTLEPITEIK
jgi:hypothetical protein